MKTNYFFILLMLLPFVFTSCNDDKDKTNNETFNVKYEIVPVNQDVSEFKVFGTYTEYTNNRMRHLFFSGKIISDVNSNTGIGNPIYSPDFTEDDFIELPWSCETTSSSIWVPAISCTSLDNTHEFILRIYIDGNVYKEIGPTSSIEPLLQCTELINL